jgi:WD40 repeat protein
VTGTKATMNYIGQIGLAEPEGQQWVHKLHYYPGWDAVVAVSHSTAAVYLLESIDDYLLDADAAIAGDVVKKQKGNHATMQALRKRKIAKQRAKEGGRRKGWVRNSYDEEADEVCQGAYQHAPATIHCCEYLATLGTFVTVSNAVADQLAMHSVHLRKDVNFTRRIHVPVKDGSHINVIKEYPQWFTSRAANSAAAAVGDFSGFGGADRAAIAVGLRNGGVQYLQLSADATRRASRVTALTELCYEQVHNDEVTDCLVIPRTGRVLTSSLDGTVAVHIPGQGVLSRYVGHEKGVTTVAYSAAFEVYFSGGFEYHALSWAENLPNSPAFALVDTNNPHSHPLCRIIAVEGTPQVYTVDVSGVVKLFDLRSLKPIDTWRAFDQGRVPLEVSQDVKSSGSRDTFHLGDIGSVCYTGASHRSVLFGAKSLYSFHTETRSADAQRTHDLNTPIHDVHVGRRLMVTCTGEEIRAWSVRNGVELRTQPVKRLTSSPVTVVALDDATGRVFTGHADGGIYCFHAETGVLARRYLKHEMRVRALVLDSVSATLISSSSRGDVYFWDVADRETSATDSLGHLDHLTGSLTPMPRRAFRPLEAPPENLRHVLTPSTPKPARTRILARWAAFRWRTFAAKRRGGNPRLALNPDSGRSTASLVVTRPRGALYLRHPAVQLIPDPRRMTVLALSGKANCRVIDHSGSRAVTTHRMFHGSDTVLTSCAYWPDRSLVVVADAAGGVYAWLCAASLDQPMLLGKWLNRCQISAYSHPLSDFIHDEGDGGEGAGNSREELIEWEEEQDAANEATMKQAQELRLTADDGAMDVSMRSSLGGSATMRGSQRRRLQSMRNARRSRAMSASDSGGGV